MPAHADYTNRSSFGDILNHDEVVVPDLGEVARKSPLQELGVTGLKRAAGFVDEEFLPALRGRKAIKVYQEMSSNDPIVGALLFAITQLLRQVTWTVEGPDNTPGSKQAVEFVESCKDDMSHTWEDMIAEIMSMLVYGWSWHEIVYKRRIGPWEKDPRRRSKYSDGLIGWRKIPIRAQETMIRWVFDESGGIKGMVQLAPPQYKTTLLPIERSLLFRPSTFKGNPEGMSVLRTAYRPWFFKKRLEEFEAIGVERDLAGMPVAKVPSSYMNAPATSKEAKVFAAFKKMVSNVRRDEHEGLVLPVEFDRETKQPLFDFELMSSGGARQFDTTSIIQRYEQRILMTVLADFIMVGHQQTGSYALHVDKTGIFRAALNAWAESIAEVFNRYAIPRLFEVNGIKLPELPRIKPTNVDPPDLTQLSQFMTSMGGLGMEWFPDPDLEKFLREVAHLPELPAEVLEIRRQMAQQTQVMNYATNRMEYLGLQQKAQMVAQGMSPEQAQMTSEAPTAERAAQEEMAQYKGHAIATRDPEVKAAEYEEAKAMEDQEERAFAREQQGKEMDAKRSIEQEKAKARLAPKKPVAPAKKGK